VIRRSDLIPSKIADAAALWEYYVAARGSFKDRVTGGDIKLKGHVCGVIRGTPGSRLHEICVIYC